MQTQRANRSLSELRFQLTLMLMILFGCFGISARAQVTGQGTITGTATDPTGAVIVGASVSVTNVETNVSHDSITNSTGYFEVNNLNPGTYRIQVSAPGFEGLVHQNITLDAAAHVNVPLQLQPGKSVVTVTVTADATLLNTESGQSGQVLTTKQLEEIPVSGSSPTWLALIAPGVQGKTGQAASTSDGGGLLWTGLTQDFGNYGNIGMNEFVLDGAPNETNGRQAAMNQSPDEVGEMKFDVNGYDAGVGHTLGVYTTATTKAGTNDLHGAVRETYTPQRWAALNHFAGLNYRFQQQQTGCVNGASTSPECYALENTFGNPGTHANSGDAALGGPVYIPHIFNGHNKFFFFVSVVDDVLSTAGSQTVTVPTLQERNGNFNDLPQSVTDPTYPLNSLKGTEDPAIINACPVGTPYFGQYQIYDPYSVQFDANNIPRRKPLCGNVIPDGRLANNAMVKLYNSLQPTPTQNGTAAALGNNYTFTQIGPQTFRSYTTREDVKITAKDNLFVRYTRQNYTKSSNDDTVGNVGMQEAPHWTDVAAIGWDHIFNERTNLQVTFGGTNYKSRCCYYPGFDKYKPSDLGLPSYTDEYAQSTNPSLLELPVLQISGYQNAYNGEPASSLGQTDNVANVTRDFGLRADVTHVQGRHTIRAGMEWRLQNNSTGISGNVSGTYNFDASYTQENANGRDAAFPASSTGLAMAAFLMGVNTSASVSQNASASLQSPYYAIYGGDTWRITPKLTIMPGLRWELEEGVVEKHNQLVTGWDWNADMSSITGPANAAYQSTLAAATAAAQAILPQSLTIAGGPVYANVNGAPRNQWQNSYRFMPRIAVAYQLTPRIVIRGGYGLFYDTLNALNPVIDQDGFSTGTGVPTSTTFGSNFVEGVSPLSDPFPAGANGKRFNTPIGSAAGSLYYIGNSPNIYEHNLVPPRENRGSVGMQWQIGPSMMLDVSYAIAYTSHISMGKNYTFTPSSFYAGGNQPYTVPNFAMGQQVPNPFLLGNFSGVASSNPAAYGMWGLNNFFTQPNVSVSSLVRPYQEYNGLNLNEPLGQSHFQEILINFTRRYSSGLTLMATMQFNDEHDRNYWQNGFDPLPSWEASNNSSPVRFTAEAVWDLPIGRGKQWLTHGWASQTLGGFQLSGTYEAQQGQLIGFGNLFYVGDPKASAIKIKHPVYVNDQASNGSNYVQWLNPGNATATASITTNADGSQTTTCTYGGNGFVTNPNCEPSGYNLRAFPPFINGVRQMGMNGANATMARNFHIWERMTMETSFIVYNVFNHQVLGGVNTNPTDPNFGRIFGDGWPNSSGRWLSIQGRLRF